MTNTASWPEGGRSARQRIPRPFRGERGAVTVPVVVAVGLAMVLAVAIAAVGQGLAANIRAGTASDAAALAAAAVTFRPFGSPGDPTAEAGRFAESHGATLISCDCAIDRTYAPRTVRVEVVVNVQILGIGRRSFRSTSQAVMEPVRLLDR